MPGPYGGGEGGDRGSDVWEHGSHLREQLAWIHHAPAPCRCEEPMKAWSADSEERRREYLVAVEVLDSPLKTDPTTLEHVYPVREFKEGNVLLGQ